MRKFIFKILKFIIFAIPIYILFLMSFGEFLNGIFLNNLNFKLKASGYTDKRIEDIKNYEDIDILFIGSSHVYRGFDTRIVKEYGLTSYNLGTSSQSHIQSHILLKRNVDRLNPKLIVYDVFPSIFATDGVESSLDLLMNDKIDEEILWSSIKQNNLKLYNTLVYSFIKQFFNSKINYTNKEDKTSVYIKGGFVESNKTYQVSKQIDNSNKNLWKPNDIQLEYFEKNIDLFNSRNIDFILVQVPVTNKIADNYSNIEEYESYFRSFSTYYNFNKLIEMDEQKHFYDNRHLNSQGADKFTRFFMDEIITKKNILK